MLLKAVSSSEPERNEPVCKVPEEGAGVDGGSDDDGAATLSGAVVAVDVAAGSDGLGASSLGLDGVAAGTAGVLDVSTFLALAWTP